MTIQTFLLLDSQNAQYFSVFCSSTKEPTTKVKTKEALPSAIKEEVERAVKALREHLSTHNDNRKEVQRKLHETCEKWRNEAGGLEKKTSQT